MRKSVVKALIAAGCLAVSGHTFAATPSAQMLSDTCAGCHGTDGSSQGPAIPNLAGVSPAYFMDAMNAYNDGSRPSTIMTRIAKGYTEEEFKLMSSFFSKQKLVTIAQDFDKDKAKAGKKLHKKYCEKCHSEEGRSSADDAGVLAAQMTPYLKVTMDDFIAGDREMPKKMKKKVDKMVKKKGDKSLDELLHYYASLN